MTVKIFRSYIYSERNMAFSEEENKKIRENLIAEASVRAITLGMRKTSVEELTDAVGISKGSFYKYFDSKELLFFTVLEGIHSELYAVAKEKLEKCASLPASERTAETLMAVCDRLSETGAMRFIESDAELILRRIPEKVKNGHYHDDEAHITELLGEGGLSPVGGTSLAAATVRGLILTVSHRNEIGEKYPDVLRILISGAMKELFPGS